MRRPTRKPTRVDLAHVPEARAPISRRTARRFRGNARAHVGGVCAPTSRGQRSGRTTFPRKRADPRRYEATSARWRLAVGHGRDTSVRGLNGLCAWRRKRRARSSGTSTGARRQARVLRRLSRRSPRRPTPRCERAGPSRIARARREPQPLPRHGTHGARRRGRARSGLRLDRPAPGHAEHR